jgi:hypothetical protein
MLVLEEVSQVFIAMKSWRLKPLDDGVRRNWDEEEVTVALLQRVGGCLGLILLVFAGLGIRSI